MRGVPNGAISSLKGLTDTVLAYGSVSYETNLLTFCQLDWNVAIWLLLAASTLESVGHTDDGKRPSRIPVSLFSLSLSFSVSVSCLLYTSDAADES